MTIKDVARLSGVSTATVTRALQGHPRVLPETRRRVEEAALTLGYRPDFNARALATGASSTIGLLIPSLGDRFWAEVAIGIEEYAAEEGFAIVFASSLGDPARDRRMVELFLAKRVDGIITGGAGSRPDEWFGRAESGVPVVCVDLDERLRPHDVTAARRFPVPEMIELYENGLTVTPLIGYVSFDDVGAAAIATCHLLDLDHVRLAFLGVSPLRSAILRLLGFRRACEDREIQEPAIIECEQTLDAAFAAALEVLSGSQRPSGVVAYNDTVAIGAMRAAHALGLRVPDDVSVVGLDDIDLAEFVEPPLTTVGQPKRGTGHEAVSMLIRTIRGGEPTAHEMEGATLVLRNSTAAPPTA